MKKILLSVSLLLTVFVAQAANIAKPIKTTDPEYPRAEKDAGHGGSVVLKVHVLADGGVSDVAVQTSSGFAALDAAAAAAAAKWTFAPATDEHGAAVESDTFLRLKFDAAATPEAWLTQNCASLTKEIAEMRAQDPTRKPSDSTTYRETMSLLIRLPAMKPMPARIPGLQELPAAFDAVLAHCEKHPKAIYQAVLEKKLGMPVSLPQAPR